MTAIQCDTTAARDLILREADAIEVPPNPKSYELWRIVCEDCIAVAYRGKVLPQGRNPKRVADIVAQVGHGQQEQLL